MTAPIKIEPPLTDEVIGQLKAGDFVFITGVLYTARDTAHKSMAEDHTKGRPLPVDLKGQILYYTGPTPAAPGRPIGAAGPTTSYRMDAYTPFLLELGLKGMIGKGPRGQVVKDAMKKHKAVYFMAVGGAGALISKAIKKAEIAAYAELGAEAMLRLEVVDFPAVVVNDAQGEDLYRISEERYPELGDAADESC